MFRWRVKLGTLPYNHGIFVTLVICEDGGQHWLTTASNTAAVTSSRALRFCIASTAAAAMCIIASLSSLIHGVDFSHFAR